MCSYRINPLLLEGIEKEEKRAEKLEQLRLRVNANLAAQWRNWQWWDRVFRRLGVGR